MIKWITIAALGFSLCKFFNFALINLLSDSWAKARARLVLQCLDFVWITSVMVVCRARKEWPPYFTLSINELPNVQDENGERRSALPPSSTSMITEKFLFEQDGDDAKSFGSIGSDEAVMFVNPCNYTLEADEWDKDEKEVSAFDSIIEDESGQGLLKGSKDELRQRIQSGDQSIDENHVKSELTLAFRDKKQIK